VKGTRGAGCAGELVTCQTEGDNLGEHMGLLKREGHAFAHLPAAHAHDDEVDDACEVRVEDDLIGRGLVLGDNLKWGRGRKQDKDK